MAEDDAVDIEHENSNRFEEYEWCGQKRIRATTLLEGGFRGIKQLDVGSGTVVTRLLLVAGHHFHHVGITAGGALWPCCLPVMCILKWMYLGGEMEL